MILLIIIIFIPEYGLLNFLHGDDFVLISQKTILYSASNNVLNFCIIKFILTIDEWNFSWKYETSFFIP